jgi:signal recognition particle subunit SEC65
MVKMKIEKKGKKKNLNLKKGIVKSTAGNGDVRELKKILKRLTIKYLQVEEKKLPKDKYSKVKKKFMDKVDTLDAINDLKKAIQLLIKKLGKSKDIDEIRETLKQIKDKPTPQPQVSGGGGGPVITITQPSAPQQPQFFPFQGGRESNFVPEESNAEKKLKDLEKKLKEDRLKEASKKQKEKIDKLKKPKQRDPKEKRDSPPKGPVERLKLTPREFYDLYTPAYMSFEDFIEQDLDVMNEDNEDIGIEPISLEDYIQMLEDDNFNVDPEGIGADGFIKDEYLREQFPDIYDNHYGTTTTLNPNGTVSGNEKTKRNVRDDVKKAYKFNKLLKDKYKKAGRGTLKVDDVIDVMEQAPEFLDSVKHYYNEYVIPTYDYVKEEPLEKLKNLTAMLAAVKTGIEVKRALFSGLSSMLRNPFKKPPPADNNDNNDNNDSPPPPPDMGGGSNNRRRPPPSPPPKEDEDKDEGEPEPTTQFDTANIINELSTGISAPSSSDVTVNEPIVENVPLTDRIYGVEIPRATSLMTAGIAMLGAASASGLLTRRLPTPFQQERQEDRLQRIYEESYNDLQNQPATGLGADPRRLLEFEEASRNRNQASLDLDRDRTRAEIRGNIQRRATAENLRNNIISETETRGLERRRLRESGRERDARQDLGEVQRNQHALRDELVDRQNMPQASAMPISLSANRGPQLTGRFSRPPGRPPRNTEFNYETGRYDPIVPEGTVTIDSFFRAPPEATSPPRIDIEPVEAFAQAQDEEFDRNVEEIGEELAEERRQMELTPPTEE